MIVRELIKELSKLDQEAKVVMKHNDLYYSEVTLIEEDEALAHSVDDFDLLKNYKNLQEMQDWYGTDDLAFISICVLE